METFEAKVEKVKEILQNLSKSEISLEESLKLYQEGAKRLNEAQKMLEEAKLVYEEIELGNLTGEKA